MRLRWGETLERVLWATWAALGLLARPRAAGELGCAGLQARPRAAGELGRAGAAGQGERCWRAGPRWGYALGRAGPRWAEMKEWRKMKFCYYFPGVI